MSPAPRTSAVFHGWRRPGIAGISASTPHPPINAGKAIEDYPIRVAQAVELLLRNGVGGPYGLALGRDEYTQVIQSTEHGGYLLSEHLKRILEGPLVWAPGVKGAMVVSLRGGDFLFESGQDISVGYASHDAEPVSLYLEESFSFRVASPRRRWLLDDVLSTAVLISREPTPIMFRRVADDHATIRKAWQSFETAVGLKGRKFFGLFDASIDEYWVCVKLKDSDDADALDSEIGEIPGGRYLRARLEGEPPGVYERIPAGFDAMEANGPRDAPAQSSSTTARSA